MVQVARMDTMQNAHILVDKSERKSLLKRSKRRWKDRPNNKIK
jgi:hypothetical protein